MSALLARTSAELLAVEQELAQEEEEEEEEPRATEGHWYTHPLLSGSPGGVGPVWSIVEGPLPDSHLTSVAAGVYLPPSVQYLPGLKELLWQRLNSGQVSTRTPIQGFIFMCVKVC